ncbi:MAG TPA: EamA/RhaT family transporter, partial [Alphaproteobacteria bacterium]|nr:EamA/RhaT family transporter [Alphaproteobacteria bacterium]
MSVLTPFVWKAPDATGWALLLLLGAVACAAHYILIQAYRFAPASVLQPFHYTVLIWVTIIGYLVFGNFPDGWTIGGGLVVVAGGLYALHRQRVKQA